MENECGIIRTHFFLYMNFAKQMRDYLRNNDKPIEKVSAPDGWHISYLILK